MKKSNQFIIALFLVPIFVFAMLNAVWPAAEKSVAENRKLAQWPHFSTQALFSGEYMLDIEKYFSDQFPFRPFFLGTHQQALTLFRSPLTGDIDMVFRPDGDIGEGEHIEPEPSDHVILPTQTTTEPSETTVTPTSVETSTPTDPEPTPIPTSPTTTEPEATAPPVTGEVKNYSAVIIIDDRAMELYYFNKDRIARYIELVGRLEARLPDTRIFNLVASTSVEFYSPEKYHINNSSQKMAISYIYDNLPESIITVDAYDKIIRHIQDYLYFRTDHHWTARGAYHAYTAFCESAGLEAVPLDAMESGFIEGGFVGSLYKYTNSPILKNNPDRVEYFMPIVDSQGIAFQSITMTEGYRIRAVNPQITSSSKYLAFIGGDHPLAHFNTELKNGRSILVLKESYGNAFVPFLTNHYEDVYVIDPRSLKGDLVDFVHEKGIDDILVINYSFGVTSKTWLNGLEALIG